MKRPVYSLIIALLAAITWQLPAVFTVSRTIKQDSFLTLTPAGATGLALLTTVLIGVLIYTNIRVARFIRKYLGSNFITVLLAMAASFILFVLLRALSPQIYYFYYLLIIDGLPWQWVVRDWLPLETTARLLLSSSINNTSRLATGIALIFLLIHTFLFFRPIKR